MHIDENLNTRGFGYHHFNHVSPKDVAESLTIKDEKGEHQLNMMT